MTRREQQFGLENSHAKLKTFPIGEFYDRVAFARFTTQERDRLNLDKLIGHLRLSLSGEWMCIADIVKLLGYRDILMPKALHYLTGRGEIEEKFAPTDRGCRISSHWRKKQ